MKVEIASLETTTDGPADISLQTTAEYGDLVERIEKEDSSKHNFTKNDFEQALQKVTRKIRCFL